MPNPFFKYKQFTVYQDQCAMKVCTDSSLFGALIDSKQAKNILDIGTGTGVLSLMQAQKSTASITAVEIEENAAKQAASNFIASPWNERLELVLEPIQDFSKKHNTQFDLIISNPPFFKDNFKSPNASVNMARHDALLPQDELLDSVLKLLTNNGAFWLLLPEYEFDRFEKLSDKQLFCNTKYNIKDRVVRERMRVVGKFERTKKPTNVSEIIVKNEDGSYTDVFSSWLKDYYLIF